MSVNDDEPVVGLVGQERLADPAQVRLGLLVERDSRADPGVNEQVVAEAAGVGKALAGTRRCSCGMDGADRLYRRLVSLSMAIFSGSPP